MPFSKKIKTEAGILGIWELTETADLLQKDYDFSQNEKEKFAKLRAEKRKCEFLAIRLLLKQLLSKKIEIEYKKTGKPFLKNHHLNISISHSRNLVAVIISKQKVGIDVEITNRDIDRVAQRFLNHEEYVNIQNSGEAQKTKIIYWGAKESIFKCSDYEGVQFYKQILIQPFTIGTEGTFTGKLCFNDETEYYKLWYFPHQNNMVVFCVEEKNELQ